MEPIAKWLILTSLQSHLVLMCLKLELGKYVIFLWLPPPLIMEPILACHHTLAGKRKKSSDIFGTGSGKDFKGGVRECSLGLAKRFY